MLVPCLVIKSFGYSEDGFTTKRADAGKVVGVPVKLVDGLRREGFVEAKDVSGKAMGASPENKMLGGATENKVTENKCHVAKGPRGKWYVMDGDDRVSSGYDTQEEGETAMGGN